MGRALQTTRESECETGAWGIKHVSRETTNESKVVAIFELASKLDNNLVVSKIWVAD
jgi:hypothetical protein